MVKYTEYKIPKSNFAKEGHNFVIYGDLKAGKTHNAIGIKIKADMEGFYCSSGPIYSRCSLKKFQNYIFTSRIVL